MGLRIPERSAQRLEVEDLSGGATLSALGTEKKAYGPQVEYDDRTHQPGLAGGGAMPRPYPLQLDPEAFYLMVEASTRLYSMIRLVARMTVGLGWAFLPANPDDAKDEEVQREIVEMTDRFADLDAESPSERNPYGDPVRNEMSGLLMAHMMDKLVTGNGFYELVFRYDGGLDSVHYQPSRHVRWRMDGNGFVRRRADGSRVYYKRLGDPRDIDAETGEIFPPGALDPVRRATTLVHQKIPYPGSDWYGLPPFVQAGPAVALRRDVAEINTVLLEKDVFWPLFMMADNGRLDPGSKKDLIDIIVKKDGSGEDAPEKVRRTSRAILLQPDSANTTREPTKIRPERVEGRSEGVYRETSKEADEELREAIGPDGIYLGSTAAGRAAATIARMLSAETFFHPMAAEEEDLFNRRILPLAGMRRTRLQLRRAKVLDPIQEAIILQKIGASDALSLNGLLDLARKFVPDFSFPRWKEAWADQVPLGLLQAVAPRSPAVDALVTQLLQEAVSALRGSSKVPPEGLPE
jgi:hypothetical protein